MSSVEKSEPVNMVFFHDFWEDLDDTYAQIMAAYLERLGLIRTWGTIANLWPALVRARVGKGTYQQLGFPNIPVGVGTRVCESIMTYPDVSKILFIAREDEVVDGKQLLVDILRNPSCDKLTLSLNSGLTDAWELLRDHEELFVKKVAQVCIMGDVEMEGDEIQLRDGYLVPGKAANVLFDQISSKLLYQRLQDLDIPMVVVSKEVARNCKFRFNALDKMASSANLVGPCLFFSQMTKMKELFEKASAPVGDPRREGLPARCDREWYFNDFCDGIDPGRIAPEYILPHLKSFNLYDPTNVIASVPVLRNQFFNPTPVEVNCTTHLVIGVSFENHGIKNPAELKRFMEEGMELALEWK